jgi:hypothetical protein
MWSERLSLSFEEFGYLCTFTVAIPTTIRSLIIRTARTTIIRERVKIGLILV